MSGTNSPPATLAPPIQSPPLNQDALSSQPWLEYHQGVADQLAGMPAKLRKGVTDGSDAAAGDIGEYMSAAGGAVSLVSVTVTNLTSLNLTAGDWDVAGQVVFATGSSGTRTFFGAGIGALDTYFSATFPTSTINQAISTSAHRYNVAGPTTVWVVASAGFTGTVTATGSVWARRVR